MTETEFQVGELIENRYSVLEVVGHGGMGSLYRVSDEARDGQTVALKTVRLAASAAERDQAVERFRREFTLLTQLRHPNLVLVYNYGVTSSHQLYFTMEWIDGRDLGSGSHETEPQATIPLIVQICRALAYLHARGVIHGDLKPSNVLLAGEARDLVKIVDFGVAMEMRSSEAQARYYTPGYTAPEMRGRLAIDLRVDLYSLGAMWYALLVGSPPAFMLGADQLVRLALGEALEDRGAFLVQLGPVITRLLATKPDERYHNADEVIEAINAATGRTYALETPETARSYALRGRFVGREMELRVMQAIWDQARSGEDRLVLISGEGGVGKTRLVEEFAVQAELEGAYVARGQCVEEGGIAYRPWREVLRVLIRYVGPSDTARMRRVGPVLATVLPELWEQDYMAGLDTPAKLDPHLAQQRLNSAIGVVLQAAAKQRPVLVVIEDGQWADEATLSLLDFLSRMPAQGGLLICVTYRSHEIAAHHPLASLGGKRVKRLPLQNLSPKATVDLVRSMLGFATLPPLLSERVQQTTGGNAFFVQELIRSLAEDGEVLHKTVEGWFVDRSALSRVCLPESIHQLVDQRLRHLPEDVQRVLQWAAVVGPVFWGGAVEELGQVAKERVRAALQRGMEQDLIVERDAPVFFKGEREYMFTNPTVREVSYASISVSQRQAHHNQVATWLMARGNGHSDEHLGLIASHLQGAGRGGEAVVYLQRAGEQAAGQFAHAEAISYFERALDLIPADDVHRRYSLLLAHEGVLDIQGARDGQSRDLDELQDLADALDDDGRRMEVLLRQANYAFATSDYPATIVVAQAAIDLARAIGDVGNETAGYVQWGRALWRQGAYADAQVRYEQALGLAREAGLHSLESTSLRSLGLVSFYLGDYSQAEVYFEQALDTVRQLGDRWSESKLLIDLGIVARRQGQYDVAQSYLEESLPACREIGDRRSEGRAMGNLGTALMNQGEYRKARTHYERSLAISREVGDRGEESFRLYNLALLTHLLGDDGMAREYSQRALELSEVLGERDVQGYALNSLGHALLASNHPAEAIDAYRRAVAVRRELGQSHLAAESLAGLAGAWLVHGDSEQALDCVEDLLAYLEANTLAGTEEPFRVYLTCYQVLENRQDPRAQMVLEEAYRLLHKRASMITQSDRRRSFLEQVAAHQAIVQAWEEGG